ncbi:MAG: TetR family transcriptional regulator [Myxococcota bacterium]
MGRPSNRDERRRDIVEAALVVMSTRGFDGASVQAIAKQAGLSAGLLHHHFGSKAAVLEALLHTLEDRVQARAEALAARKRGAWGRLEAWVDAHLATGADADPHAVGAWVWIGAEALKGGKVRALFGDVMQRRHDALRGLLEAAAKERGARVDAEQLATTVLATVEGYYGLAASSDVVPGGSAAGAVRRLLDRLIPKEA